MAGPSFFSDGPVKDDACCEYARAWAISETPPDPVNYPGMESARTYALAIGNQKLGDHIDVDASVLEQGSLLHWDVAEQKWIASADHETTFGLTDLSDVDLDLGPVVDGALLAYSDADGQWIPYDLLSKYNTWTSTNVFADLADPNVNTTVDWTGIWLNGNSNDAGIRLFQGNLDISSGGPAGATAPVRFVLGTTYDFTFTMQADGVLAVPVGASAPSQPNHLMRKADIVESIIVACSDETTALTTGVKTTFRAPYSFVVSGFKASLTTAASAGTLTGVVKADGTTVATFSLAVGTTSTKEGGNTPPVISQPNLIDDAVMTVEITGAPTGAKGLKITLIGARP